jgi:hypothetical protein
MFQKLEFLYGQADNIARVEDGFLQRSVSQPVGRDPLVQACQTGGPRAACGPIACLMRPAVTFLSHTFTSNCKQLIIYG